MKTVFQTIPDCIHVYFQFTQNHGRCGNVFFDGNTLYSYGRHFELAKLVDGTLFINTQSYSNSTSKHQNYCLRSINNDQIDKVVRLDFGRGVFDPYSISNYHYSRANYYRYASRSKGFKDLAQIEYHFNQLQILENEGLFKIDLSRFEFDLNEALDLLKARRAKQALINKVSEAKREAKRARELELRKATEGEKLAAWLKGETSATFYALDKVHLRVRANSIETTKGARVPLRDGLRLLEKIRAGVDVTGEKIASYQVTRVTLDHVQIGCHKIEFSTINELFQ
jgi:hypothetical protein